MTGTQSWPHMLLQLTGPVPQAHRPDGLCPTRWRLVSSKHFDLSICTEDLLPLIPLVLLLIFGSYDIYSLKRNGKQRSFTAGFRGLPAYLSKLFLSSLLALLFIAQLFVNTFVGSRADKSLANISIGLQLLATLFTIPIIHLNHTRARRSSSPVLFYYLFTLINNCIILRTSLAYHWPSQDTANFALFSAAFALQFAIFALECIGPEESAVKQTSKGYIELPESDGPTEVPEVTANIFQRLTFSWMGSMMAHGYKTFLTEEDLWRLPRKDQADSLSENLATSWQRQLDKGGKPSLIFALVRSFGGPFFIATVFKLCQDVLAFVQPQLLKRLLVFVSSYSTEEPEEAFHGTIIALGMFALSILQTMFLHQYFHRCFETGMRMRAALIGQIYNKSLKLSNDERSGRLTGDIVNLQSTDATRLQDICTYGAIAWSGMFQMILAFVSLYSLLGWPMFAGVAIMVISLPLNTAVARWQTKLQRKQMKNKDHRTRLMSEILTNIKSIKLYGWENAFSSRLFAVRNDQELHLLRKMGIIASFSTFLWSFTPFMVSFSTFALFAVTSKKPLTSEIVFPAISLFQLLQFPLAAFPMVVEAWSQAYVSVGRLQDFLGAKELQADAVEIVDLKKVSNGDEVVSIVDGTFKWSSSALEPSLNKVNLSVKKGQLLAVVGRVGSGKSSLLAAMLGEMTKVSGKASLRGKVAYVSQTPWLQGTTVEKNIVFGHQYEKEFYEAVIDACALREDLAILVDGDQTEVGEKGVTLSGGQKARISLARAVYSRADIILFDDPLSAVDAHVGASLFRNVIGPEGLLASKARILCTNAISFLQQCDEVVMFKRGAIVERGSPTECLKADSEIAKLMREFGRAAEEEPAEDGEVVKIIDEAPEDAGHSAISAANFDPQEKARKLSTSLTRRPSVIGILEEKQQTLAALKRSSRPKEARSQGSVKWDVYKRYVDASGIGGVSFYVVSLITVQLVQILSNVWLKNWAQHNTSAHSNSRLPFYLGIYFALGFGSALLTLINGVVLFTFCVVRSAKALHDSMFNSILRAPMLFFETTTTGTILNRFSRDVQVIDEMLPRVFSGFFRTMSGIAGTIVVIAYSTPAFILIAIPIGFLYKRIQSYYLATSRELKRLDSTTKSPIFTSFGETLAGVASIRAYRHQARFIANNEAQVDRNLEAYFPSVSCNRWLAVRLELIGSLLIFASAELAVFTLVKFNNIDAGLVGLMMSYSLSISQSLNWVVRTSTDVETNIVSVERVQEYITTKSEAPLEIPDKQPPSVWPKEGAIEFREYSTRYREGLDLVLKNVSFKIEPSQKVGVCGRTGAGKSSLTLALYRVIEKVSGSIIIDGVDISTIGLHDLRSVLSIIPQDSQCFEGTLRQNLDPEGRATDEEIWNALENAHLKEHVEAMDGHLEAKIDEAGSNLSSGQRQLMCLSRALLRRSKILVLDEATSAIDPQSDQQVQEVIRTQFKDCTIITIAHRLETILDNDKILVMSQGQLAEYGSPQELLNDKTSTFYSLAREAGLIGGSNSAPLSRVASSAKIKK